MVQTYQKSTAGGALLIIAVLLVSTIPLNLGPASYALADLDPSHVYTSKSKVKQGEPVTIFLSQTILSADVGVIYFLFDFHDPLDQTVQVIDTRLENDYSVSHVYNKVGRYDVSVLALRGNISRVFNVPVTVVPEPLLVQLTAPSSSFGEDVMIPFQAVLGDTVSTVATDFFWDFGDGQSATTNTPFIEHSYKNSGIYTPKLRVYTNDTVMYTAFMDVNISDNTPDVTIIADNSANEDEYVDFFAQINNPDSDFPTLEYVWMFDDGSYALGPTTSHRFYESRTHAVSVTVYDDDGIIGSAVHNLEVQNVNPTISLSNEILGYYEGETAITLASVYDTPSDYPNLVYDWNVDADGIQASIPMMDDGLYRFNATVTDDDGLNASASTQLINIINVPPIVSLQSAYSNYSVSFAIYGTIGTEVNMTLFSEEGHLMNGSLTSFSTQFNQTNTTSFGSYSQDLLEYFDILYYLNNKTIDYDNYVITTFSFDNADDFTLVNHCISGSPCSSTTWRQSITPLSLGFPVTMNFQYFDPGNDNITLGVDFGSVTFQQAITASGSANIGTGTITGALPYGENPTSIRYWGLDDDGGRRDHALPLINYATIPNPQGYLNISSWARSGHVLSHYAPGALVTLNPGSAYASFNITTPDNQLWEGTAQQFHANAAYRTPNALNYEWHMGDGSAPIFLKSPFHTYKYSGTYLVWVKISDGDYESVAYTTVNVENVIQSIEPMIVGGLQEGNDLRFSISGLVDAYIHSSNYSFIWDFGDGRREFGREVSHTYQGSGNYTLGVSILNEHNVLDTQTLRLPIRARAPFVNVPLQADYQVLEGENLQLQPLVTDSAIDRGDLSYSWTVGNLTYSTASVNLQYPAGRYNGSLEVTDNDSMVFSHRFNFTVREIPVVLSLADAQLYGRSINSFMTLQGSLSPNIFSWESYQSEYSIKSKLFAKNGSVLAEGSGNFIDNFMFEFDVYLGGIYDYNKLQEVKKDTRPILTILRDTPMITSGDYRVQIELFDSLNISIGLEDAMIHYVADQDNDILQDEVEIIFGDRIDDLEMDPIKEDTNDNGISDSVDFLIADDPDQDGLPGILEEELGTDPDDADSDDDGLQDGWGRNGLGELTHGSDPLNPDTDGDGINDFHEVTGWESSIEKEAGRVLMVQFTSDPTLADTDSDGVNDYFELSLGANPRFSDSDEDGLDDLSEQERGTRLTNFDTDGDGLSDYREVEETFGTFVYLFENFRVNSVYRIYNTNPLNADTDGDGVSDYDEVEIYQSVATTADSDQDSISDFDEIGNGTNLIHADTDGDLLSDGLELHGFEIPEISFTPGSYAEDGSVLVSPVLRQSTVIIYTDPTLFDTDGDGLSDSEELLGTPEISNPTLADSDGDGITDFRDPYPLIPDYAPPTFTTNSFGNEGITLTYGTGDSILSNVVESFKAAAEAVLGLVVDVGTLFVELLESLFYWKCVETFGECIYLPWLRSDAEIANRVRKALFKFATSSNERLAQIFPGYDATAQFVSRSISLNNFGVDVKTNDIGIPIDISVSGIMEMLASGAKKILEELINPTVNVYFAVEDSSGIDRVEVYVNGEYDRTISGNAQQLFFNEQFTIFAEDDGSTSTDFKFIIYDKIGNSIEIERTATVVDFVSGIANDIFKEVIDIVDVFSPWAADILAVAVTAVVDAAAFVAELALDALLFIINFVTEAVPALFEAFVHEIIGAYLDDKDYQAEQILSNLSQYYQNQRTAVVNAFDATAGAVAGNAQTGVEEIYNAITDYLPQLDEKSMLKELTGGSDFFELTDLDGTIFAFVIDYMQDEFMELFTSIINGYVEDIVESQLEQYIGPVMGLQHQILDMFGALSYDLGFGSSTSFGAPTSLNLANIKDAPSKVLDFIDSVTAPIELLSSIMDTISGENMMKVYDMFLISNPNIVYSLNDLLRAFVKPIFMLGLVTYDVISEVGELISPLSPLSPAARLDGIQTLAGIPLNALDLDMPQPSLDANDQAKALIIIRVIWKAAEHALDMAISLYVGQERYKTGRISGLTAGLEYTFRSMIFGVNLIFDIGVDILLERDPTTVVGSSFQGNLGRYVARAANFFIKGVFLSAVSFRLDPYIFTISNYDIVAAVLDVITVLSEIVITIIEIAEGATGADSIFNEWILALRIITITVTVVFTIANIITTTSFKLPSTAQAVYLGVWAVNQVLKWVTDLLIGIKLYNL